MISSFTALLLGIFMVVLTGCVLLAVLLALILHGLSGKQQGWLVRLLVLIGGFLLARWLWRRWRSWRHRCDVPPKNY